MTLLCELPGACGTGTDISEAALAVARGNATRLGAAERSSWLTADALESVSGTFHMMVSNPPYVRTGDIAHLEPEVCNFDPTIALDGGSDGLSVYRRMAPAIARVVPNGWTVLEVGYDQADDVAELLVRAVAEAGAEAADMRVCRDVAGKRRCVAVKTRMGRHA